MQKLLLVEDDPSLQFTILTALEEKGYAVDAVSTTGEAIERLNECEYPIVISDIYVDERTGLDVLDAAKRNDPNCSVILMTGRGTIETVMAATRGGAFDYIAKPFELDVMLDAIERAEDLYRTLEPGFPEQAVYAVALAHRIRYVMQCNAREAMHLIELRSGAQGHPAYRRVAQETAFHLDRRNILSATDNYIFKTVANFHETIRVNDCSVACVEPTVPDGRVGRL